MVIEESKESLSNPHWPSLVSFEANLGSFVCMRFFLPMAISQGSRKAGTHPKGCLFTCKSMD